jgi:hypothetical protein
MPPRTRPTARLLTPAGWAGLLVIALLAGALVLALVFGLGRP